MAEERVEVRISAKDLASSVVSRVTRSFGGLVTIGNQALELFGKLFRGGQRLARGFEELADRGGQLTTVQAAFNRIAGDGDAALARLRRETRGLISDYELMRNANQAVALGAADSVEAFGEMAMMSQALARSLGIDQTEALEKFTVALARQSKLRLDDLGITLDVAKANEEYARALGKNVADLTDAQKAEAFRNAAMARGRELVEQLGPVNLNAADSVRFLRTQVTNLRDRLAQLVANSPTIRAFFQDVGNIAETVATAMQGNTQDIIDVFGLLGRTAAAAFAAAWNEASKEIPLIGSLFEGTFEARRQRFAEEMRTGIEGIRAIARGVQAERDLTRVRAQRPDAIVTLPGGGGIPLPAITTGPGGGAGGPSLELSKELQDEVKLLGEAVQLGAQRVADVQRLFELERQLLQLRGRGDLAQRVQARQLLSQVQGSIGALVGTPADRLAPLSTAAGIQTGALGLRFSAPQPVTQAGPGGATVAQLARGAELFEATRTGQERYNAAVEELNTLLAAGAIDQDTYNRRKLQEIDALQTAGDASEATAARMVGAFSSVMQALMSGGGPGGFIRGITGLISLAPGVGTLAAAALQAGGQVLGNAFDSRSSRSEPLRVRLVDVDDRAAKKLEPRQQGPQRVTLVVTDRHGIAQQEYELRRRERRDAQERIPAGFVL